MFSCFVFFFCFVSFVHFVFKTWCIFPWNRDVYHKKIPVQFWFITIVVCVCLCVAKKRVIYLGSYLIMSMPYIFCHLEPYITLMKWDSQISHKIPTNLKPYTLFIILFRTLYNINDGPLYAGFPLQQNRAPRVAI